MAHLLVTHLKLGNHHLKVHKGMQESKGCGYEKTGMYSPQKTEVLRICFGDNLGQQ